MDFVKRNYLLIISTLAVAIIFLVIPFVVRRSESQWPPTLGDWGDFIGGAMALIVFLWLVASHLENQKQIASTNRDMELQLKLTSNGFPAYQNLQGRCADIRRHYCFHVPRNQNPNTTRKKDKP